MQGSFLVNPRESIVPVIGVDKSVDPILVRFLGTSFFVEHTSGDVLLATAEHVVQGWPGELGISVYPDTVVFRAELVAKDPNVDLALLKVHGYRPKKPLQLPKGYNFVLNTLVTCIEYSRSQPLGNATMLSPSARVGNVTRIFDRTQYYGKAGKDMLELSFPALRGASGAPVISNEDGSVWGIIKGNVSYHLLPAQVVTVVDEKAEIVEETTFMLPQGVAVNVKHLSAKLISARVRRCVQPCRLARWRRHSCTPA